jgi:hypothetical protein
MKPFIPTALETHLILDHGVTPEIIAMTRENHSDVVEVVGELSHRLMHSVGQAKDHQYQVYTGESS